MTENQTCSYTIPPDFPLLLKMLYSKQQSRGYVALWPPKPDSRSVHLDVRRRSRWPAEDQTEVDKRKKSCFHCHSYAPECVFSIICWSRRKLYHQFFILKLQKWHLLLLLKLICVFNIKLMCFAFLDNRLATKADMVCMFIRINK